MRDDINVSVSLFEIMASLSTMPNDELIEFIVGLVDMASDPNLERKLIMALMKNYFGDGKEA